MTFLTGRDMAVVALTFIRPLSLTRSRGGQLLSMSTPQSSILNPPRRPTTNSSDCQIHSDALGLKLLHLAPKATQCILLLFILTHPPSKTWSSWLFG
jgi:hypothetical protein